MEIGVGWFLYPPNVAPLLPFDVACCFACPSGVDGTDQAREKRMTFDNTIRGCARIRHAVHLFEEDLQ
jgi:hypothetical protein